MFDFSEVKNYDPELAEAMENELTRQRTNLELIASENLVSKAVMAAMGSHLTNKYAEGYPGKRYYGGCQYVDVVEDLARERAKEKEQVRKDDTRRKILIGSCMLKITENDEQARAKLIAQMDKYLTDERDRKLFDLI